MAPKNIFFAHPVVGEEAVGCLRVGPVLAGQRDALSEPGFHLLDQLAKATVQPAVAKTAARKLLLKPLTFHALHPLAADSVPDKESQTIPTTQEIASRAHLNVKMWVIESHTGGLLRYRLINQSIEARRQVLDEEDQKDEDQISDTQQTIS